jgi:hypothetical protein
MAGLLDQLDKWTTTHRAAEEPRPVRERMTSEEVKPRVERRMAEIDALTPEQRMVIHEYGWGLVRTFLDHGVTKPRSMRALINAVTEHVVDRQFR